MACPRLRGHVSWEADAYCPTGRGPVSLSKNRPEEVSETSFRRGDSRPSVRPLDVTCKRDGLRSGPGAGPRGPSQHAGEKGTGAFCAKHPAGRCRQNAPVPFSPRPPGDSRAPPAGLRVKVHTRQGPQTGPIPRSSAPPPACQFRRVYVQLTSVHHPPPAGKPKKQATRPLPRLPVDVYANGFAMADAAQWTEVVDKSAERPRQRVTVSAGGSGS